MSIVNEFKREMIEQYQEYIKNVSPMAPSMKTLSLLLLLCVPGANVLDLGSGFSSYMLRYYDKRLNMTVVSVDDNFKWLMKIRDYCMDHNVGSMRFIRYEDLYNSCLPDFDVVFMDLGTTKHRPSYYSDVLKRYCTPKTLVLFDDMHKPSLKRALEHELKIYNYINIGVMDQTIDEFGRYCKLVFRLRPKEGGQTK